LLALAGCGYVGPPQPPALNIPRPIDDLRAAELGATISVRFTPPSLTTEKLPVTTLESLDLFVGPAGSPFAQDRWLATARRYQIPVRRSPTDPFEIPAANWVGQELVIAVRATGKSGRQSDLSNLALLTVTQPLTTPSTPALTNTADGVRLAWTGNAPRYRILRVILNNADAQPEPLTEVDTNSYLDATTTFGVRYRYVILGINGDAQQSLPSPQADIAPVDTFAPATPSGLSAVAGPSSIDLSWTRNSEDDLAAYNLFRAVDDGPFQSIATGLTIPAFTDPRVEPGKRYRYAVSATDMAGNESARSAEASARIE
jgi:hypothetical protein